MPRAETGGKTAGVTGGADVDRLRDCGRLRELRGLAFPDIRQYTTIRQYSSGLNPRPSYADSCCSPRSRMGNRDPVR